ncbi:MAG: DUF4249 domain-containing protein [Flavobacteriales bacterium]
MKNIILTTAISFAILGSCTKIIDVELDEADKRTTIDAQIELGTKSVTSKITTSGNFFGANSNPAVTNAAVTLNDGTTDFPLINMGNGNYELSNFSATSGANYTMKVTENGQTYEAQTTMPNVVKIDTLLATFTPQSAFSDSGYLINIVFRDPGAEANYYRIELDIAGERYGTIEDMILLDDDLTNGNIVNFPLFGADVAQLGDTVTCYLRSLNKQSFDYFNAVDELLFGNAATPANPKSNFDNNALGNFSSFANDTLTIIVTQ